MATWKPKLPSPGGNCWFDGGHKLSVRVRSEVSDEELLTIWIDLRARVIEEHGIGNWQEYEDEDGRVLCVVDQYARDQLAYVPKTEHYHEIFFKHEHVNDSLCVY